MSGLRKISFQEAWETTTVFLMDEELERDIEAKVDQLLETARHPCVAEGNTINVEGVRDFLCEENNALDVILKDIGLSEERFMRIITLLRKLDRIPGALDREWDIDSIKRKILREPGFALSVAQVLVDGSDDAELGRHVPRYYLDMLNYRAFKGNTEDARKIRYEGLLIGTRGGKMGHRVECKIRRKLDEIQERYGVGYGKGRWEIIDTDIDLAVPSIQDPWVIIMSTFQETTSSGQTTKARNMSTIYERIRQFNSRNRQNRAFVNFVDGGGWLARRTDLERLVEDCHYFINLHHLDMLEAIVLQHVPKRYFASDP